MNTPTSKYRALVGTYSLLAIAASTFAIACGDDEDNDDSTTIPSRGGSTASGGAPAGEGGESGAPSGGRTPTGGTGGAASNQAGADAGGSDGGGGDLGAAGAVSCDPQGEYDCYPCAPKTNEQYLNQCSDTECSPFDNSERIPGFDGTLPEL